MNPTTKILLGGAATAIIAWFLHGQYGDRCGTPAAAPVAEVASVAAPEASVAPAAVVNCQKNVDAAIAGKTINFVTSRAEIASDSNALLDAIGTSLKDCAGTTVEVGGYTDRVGDAGMNQTLSQARADAVVKALADRGVPADRMAAKGYGETKPVNPAGPENNAADRRTEFVVSQAAAPAAAAPN